MIFAAVGKVGVTLFSTVSTRGLSHDEAEIAAFLTACDIFLNKQRPDAVWAYGLDPISFEMQRPAMRLDIPIVLSVDGADYADDTVFQRADYAVVSSEHARQFHWERIGLASLVLPPVVDPAQAESLAPIYRDFFSRITHQPGPPLVPPDVAPVTDVVTLAADYDYNNDMTTLAANIGYGTGFDDNGVFDGFTDGANDFINNYTYDPLGDTIGITQQSQAGSEINTGGTDNDVGSKGVALGYNADGDVSGEKFYASTDIASTDTANLVATVTDSYDYDQNLTGLTYVAQASGATLAAYTYAYNTAGLQTSMTYSSNTIAWNENDAYSYDPDGQLLGTTYNVGQTGGEVGTSTYETTTGDSQAYDPNGNRTSTDSTAESSATNRLLYDGTYYYNYDAEGNRTAKFISTSGALDSSATDITIYTWNNDNELTSATHYADWTRLSLHEFARLADRVRQRRLWADGHLDADHYRRRSHDHHREFHLRRAKHRADSRRQRERDRAGIGRPDKRPDLRLGERLDGHGELEADRRAGQRPRRGAVRLRHDHRGRSRLLHRLRPGHANGHRSGRPNGVHV